MRDAPDILIHTRQIYDASPLGRSLLRAASASAALALLGGTTVGIALFHAPSEAAARDVLHLGTAAIWDVPATGDAGPGQVVRWDDSRLSDARTPLAHTHAVADILGLGYYATGTDAAYLTGTLADARLSSNVALRNADNAFSAAQTIAGSVPSSVAAGQVAIGGGVGFFAGALRFKDDNSAFIVGSRIAASAPNFYLTCQGSSAACGFMFLVRDSSLVDNNVLHIGSNSIVTLYGVDGINGSYTQWVDLGNSGVARGYIGYGPTLFGTASISGFGVRSQAALHLATGGGYDRIVITSGGVTKISGSAPGAVPTGEVHIGGGNVVANASVTGNTYVYGAQAVYAGNGGAYAWTLGGVTGGALTSNCYVTITINGGTYKLLANNA